MRWWRRDGSAVQWSVMKRLIWHAWRRWRLTAWMGLLAAAVLGSPTPAVAQSLEQESYDAATHHLKQGLATGNARKRDQILLALRLTADPALAPYFTYLANLPDEKRAAHGVLGLIESGAAPQLDLKRILAIKNAAVQFQIIREAMDSDLLNESLAREALAASSLDIRGRISAAIYLLKHNHRVDSVSLVALAGSTEDLHLRAMCWALMIQAGDNSAQARLHAIESSDDKQRDAIRTDLMATIIKYDFDRLGPWALDVSREIGGDDDLVLIALEAALRAGLPEAPNTWRKRFNSTDNLATKLRLSLVALYGSPKANPALFAPMLASQDKLIHQMGKTGQAVATGQSVTEQILELLQMDYYPASIWALNYAKDRAPLETSRRVLLGMILAIDGPDQGKQQRFNRARAAAQFLFERDPQGAGPSLNTILTNFSDDKLKVHAVLMGLIDSAEPGVAEAARGLPPFVDRDTQRLAVMVRALGDQTLDDDQLRELQYLVSGAGQLRETIRIRLGWTYLKMTGQHEGALKDVLSH